jgi:hypothetical protein
MLNILKNCISFETCPIVGVINRTIILSVPPIQYFAQKFLGHLNFQALFYAGPTSDQLTCYCNFVTQTCTFVTFTFLSTLLNYKVIFFSFNKIMPIRPISLAHELTHASRHLRIPRCWEEKKKKC